ncbi:MAG: rubredoxin [Nanoarchaeota archaeon]|nr:rubredoxin [Nanoarchaeota archaeon]
MAKYNCSTCGYSTTSGRQPKKCPYCSRENTMEEEENAEEILSRS